jgi:hypothetical protein
MLEIVLNELELRKLQPPKVERVKNSKNKPPKNFLVYRSVVMRVPR